MGALRPSLRIVGIVLVLGLHVPLLYVYAFGATLREVNSGPFAASISLGYLAMAGLAAGRRRAFPASAAGAVLDAWLLGFPIAVGLCFGLVLARWPLRFPGWDAHGMGASGGEANAALLPWIHAGTWVLLVRAKTRQADRGAG